MFDYQGSSSFTKTPYTLGLSVFVPEPGVLGLLGIGLFGLGLTRRKRMT